MSDFGCFGKFCGKGNDDAFVGFDDLSVGNLDGRPCVGWGDIAAILFGIVVAVVC